MYYVCKNSEIQWFTNMAKFPKLALTFSLLCCLASFCLADDNYKNEIDTWHSKRIDRLKAESGWLSLVGLYWLADGDNTFGSSGKNKVQFPEGTIAASAGTFNLTDSIVKMTVNDGVDITVDGETTKESILLSPETDQAPVASCQNLRWTIIKRDNKFGVRLRDLKSPKIAEFKGIDRYKVDEKWKVEAILINDTNQKTIPITNVLGQTNQTPIAGKLVFTLNGTEYTLDALDEGSDLFIIFGDPTNEDDTYASGRFLYAKHPEEGQNKVVLDFNKSYNPPCAFTDFATCPLPPKQNILPIPIKAGEKRFEF